MATLTYCDKCDAEVTGTMPPEILEKGAGMDWLVSHNIIAQIPQDAGPPAIVSTNLCQTCYRRLNDSLARMCRIMEDKWKANMAQQNPPGINPYKEGEGEGKGESLGGSLASREPQEEPHDG